MTVARPVVICLASASMIGACGAPSLPRADLRGEPSPAGDHQACVASSEDERLVVDWPALERAKLESALRRGLVMLHAEGCTVRIVDTCTSRLRYEYAPTSRQREVTMMRNVDDVRARLPMGALRFGASIERARALAVRMTIVGRYESAVTARGLDETDGECADVTHVVSSVSVGAFEISTTNAFEASGHADALFAEAHARTGTERRHLDSAGVEERCNDARRSDDSPPEDCGIPLRLELRPLAARGHRMQTGTPTAAPASQEETARAMAVAKSAIMPCYREALARRAKVGGSLTFTIRVDRDGSVRSLSNKYDVPDELASCASARMQTVAFPPSQETRPRVFVVPMLFRNP